MVRTQVGIYTIIITLFIFGVYIFERLVKNKQKKQQCYLGMLGLYAVAVLWLTLFFRQPQGERFVLLVPLKSYPLAYQGYLDNVAASAKDGVVSALERIRSFLYAYNWFILNALLFVPYGILAPKVFPRAKCMKLFFFGVLGSAIIELTQYIFRLGCFDVDDLIQNTLGIGIGYLLASLLRFNREEARPNSERQCGEC